MKIKGLKELQKELKQMADRAESLNGQQSVPLGELMTSSFMESHTSYSDFDKWLEGGGFSANSAEEFDAIDENELDKYVASSTKFDSWQDMLGDAAGQWGMNQIMGK
ncbi:MAG: hypothetical protein IKG65_07495 [Exiguobacterium sp.]|nr:hypothetical protein [Exiguobacterium sp.]MBR2758936.1 hypothetical protein [Exiguobacterium sp.]MBR3062238.1 hypothetical protein [Exiguobacterium sp.]MBR3218039.1 hypothetical protein [Exiguobacterium sp.]